MNDNPVPGVGITFQLGKLDPETNKIVYLGEPQQNMITNWGMAELRQMWFSDATKYAILGTSGIENHIPITISWCGLSVYSTSHMFTTSDLNKHIKLANGTIIQIVKIISDHKVETDTILTDNQTEEDALLYDTNRDELYAGFASSNYYVDPEMPATTDTIDNIYRSIVCTRAHRFAEINNNTTFKEIGWSPYMENKLQSKVFGRKVFNQDYNAGDIPIVVVSITRLIYLREIYDEAGTVKLGNYGGGATYFYGDHLKTDMDYSSITQDGFTQPASRSDSLLEGFKGYDRKFVCREHAVSPEGFELSVSENHFGLPKGTANVTYECTSLPYLDGVITCTAQGHIIQGYGGNGTIVNVRPFGCDFNMTSTGHDQFAVRTYDDPTATVPHLLCTITKGSQMHLCIIKANENTTNISNTKFQDPILGPPIPTPAFLVWGSVVVLFWSGTIYVQKIYEDDLKSANIAGWKITSVAPIDDEYLLACLMRTSDDYIRFMVYKYDSATHTLSGVIHPNTTMYDLPNPANDGEPVMQEHAHMCGAGDRRVYTGLYGFVYRMHISDIGLISFSYIAQSVPEGTDSPSVENSWQGVHTYHTPVLYNDGIYLQTNKLLLETTHWKVLQYGLKDGPYVFFAKIGEEIIGTRRTEDGKIQYVGRKRFDGNKAVYNTDSFLGAGAVTKVETADNSSRPTKLLEVCRVGLPNNRQALVWLSQRTDINEFEIRYHTAGNNVAIPGFTSGSYIHKTYRAGVTHEFDHITNMRSKGCVIKTTTHNFIVVTTKKITMVHIQSTRSVPSVYGTDIIDYACVMETTSETAGYAYVVSIKPDGSLQIVRFTDNLTGTPSYTVIETPSSWGSLPPLSYIASHGNNIVVSFKEPCDAYYNFAICDMSSPNREFTTPFQANSTGYAIGVGDRTVYIGSAGGPVHAYAFDVDHNISYHSRVMEQGPPTIHDFIFNGETVVKLNTQPMDHSITEYKVLSIGSIITGKINASRKSGVSHAGNKFKYAIFDSEDSEQHQSVLLLLDTDETYTDPYDAALLNIRTFGDDTADNYMEAIRSISLVSGPITNPKFLWGVNFITEDYSGIPTSQCVIPDFRVSHSWKRM